MAASDSRSDFLQTRNGATDGGPVEAASFIFGTLTELSQLARRHRLDMLGYLLDMALLEADETVRQKTRHDKL